MFIQPFYNLCVNVKIKNLKIMKKILFISVLLNLATCLFAMTVTVKGTLKNDSTQKGIANHVVYLHAFKINALPADSTKPKPFNFETKVMTDSNGVYQIVFDMPDTSNIDIDVYTYDCTQKMLDKTAKSGLNKYEFNFTLCDGNVKPIPPCTADFNFNGNFNKQDSLSMKPALFAKSFQFENVSKGNITKIFWDFGDGNYSNDSAPKHTFINVGLNKVCLFIGGPNCQNTICKVITIQPVDSMKQPCLADFYVKDSLNIDYPNLPQNTFRFVNNSTGNLLKCNWDFSDGTTPSAEKNPIHIFKNRGAYKVCLTVSSTNCNQIACQPVYIGNPDSIKPECHAAFYINKFKLPKDSVIALTPADIAPNTLNFVNVSSGDIASVNWDFGDGSVSTDKSPVHAFSGSGTYKVCLTISGSTCKDFYCQTVFLGNSDSTLRIDPAIPDTIFNTRKIANIPLVDKLISQLDSCVIDYQKPIESANVDKITILDKNKAEVIWKIKQYDTTHVCKVIVNYNKIGLTQFTLNLTCSIGNAKSQHSNTFVDSYDMQLTGIKESSANEMTLVVHPNPVTDYLSIDLNLTNNEKVIVSVMNQFGQTIQSTENFGNAGMNRININASSLATGIYFVQIKNDQNKYITKKFVKIN